MNGFGFAGGLGGIMGGLGLGEYGAYTANRNMNNQLGSALNTLGGYGRQNGQTFQNSLGMSTYPAAQKQVQQGAQEFGQTLGGMPLHGFGLPNQGTGIPMLGQQAQNRQAAQAQGKMEGFGNYGFQQGLKDLNTEAQMGAANNLAQQSLVPFGGQLEQAAHSGDMYTGMGSLLNTAGMLGAEYSMLPSAHPYDKAMHGYGFNPSAGVSSWAAKPGSSLYFGMM